MASVSLKNLRKVFGGLEILKGVSFDIGEGEFVALVGPSGCGKSTLLRLIAGLEGVSGGEIWIGGKVVNRVAPKDRDIAMVFQNYALYPHMTVAQNMGFSLMLQGVAASEIDRKVKSAAAILGLTSLLDRFTRQLSGGQRQRVAMGRAIVRDPQVFLFDEPLSNLDAKLRVQMRAEIKALHQRLKTTTIYVTHDQVEAMTMADRIVVMNGGNIEQIGTPLELYDRPGTRFVAGFIGSPAMNFMEGAIVAGGRSEFRSDNGMALELPPMDARFDGKRVTAGFRPESVHLSSDSAGLEAEVMLAEPTGSETHILANLHGNQMTAVFRERISSQPGERISIRIEPRNIHLFDASAEKRIEIQ